MSRSLRDVRDMPSVGGRRRMRLWCRWSVLRVVISSMQIGSMSRSLYDSQSERIHHPSSRHSGGRRCNKAMAFREGKKGCVLTTVAGTAAYCLQPR